MAITSQQHNNNTEYVNAQPDDIPHNRDAAPRQLIWYQRSIPRRRMAIAESEGTVDI
jgi:hypothetical protein